MKGAAALAARATQQDRITDRQAEYIQSLLYEMRLHHEQAQWLTKLLGRAVYGVYGIRFQEAPKVIGTLRQMWLERAEERSWDMPGWDDLEGCVGDY